MTELLDRFDKLLMTKPGSLLDRLSRKRTASGRLAFILLATLRAILYTLLYSMFLAAVCLAVAVILPTLGIYSVCYKITTGESYWTYLEERRIAWR